MKVKIYRCLMLFILALLSFGNAVQSKVVVVDPWVRATVDGQQMGGAFLTLKNEGVHDASLEWAQSDVAAQVELHQMQTDRGVMHMQQIHTIHIPAKQSVVLAPGGLHVMLMGLKRTLRAGDVVSLLVVIRQDRRIQRIRVKAIVRALSQ